ncbi:endo-alpha-N-acetylgalactosaminidase family protein [Clostridium sp. B9]|uniref:endo-alpha-N-acetylgalactosaminidase family protein n=1 Tax=Clostridium sp. B9 TaxID=3423224 RepID=UPI003D2F3877
MNKKIALIIAAALAVGQIPTGVLADEIKANDSEVKIEEGSNIDLDKSVELYEQVYDRPEGITWTGISGNGTPEVSDGFLRITNSGDYRFYENESPILEDGELEVRFQISDEEAQGQFGVLFRADANGHAGVAYDTGTKWVIHKNGGYELFEGPEVQAGDWVTLKVVFVGNHLTISINGEEYYNKANNTIPVKSGHVGYRSWFSNKTSTVDYIKYGPVGSIGGVTPEYVVESIEDTHVETFPRLKPELPTKVRVKYTNGSAGNANVIWDGISKEQYQEPGEFIVEGTIEGSEIKAKAYVTVRGEAISYETNFDTAETQGNWQVVSGGGDVNYVDGTVQVGMNGVSLAYDEASPDVKNFIYETEFTTNNDNGRIGLMFRYKSPTEWGGICYDAGSWVWKTGAKQYGSFPSSFKLEANTTYKMKVKVEDNNVSLWINDELQGTQTIANLPQDAGKIGLTGWHGNKTITLDNVKVNEITPPAPPIVEERYETIESELMEVTLDANYPRVLNYTWKDDGKVLAGEDEQLYIVEINGDKYIPEIISEFAGNKATYTISIPEINVTLVVDMIAEGNKIRMEFKEIREEGDFKVQKINFPNHNLASVKNIENGQIASVLTTGDWNNIIEEFTTVDEIKPGISGKTYGFISNDDFAITVNSNVIEGGNRVSLSTSSRNGYIQTGIGSGAWTYREVLDWNAKDSDGNPMAVEEELPWAEVMIARDENGNSKVDWQDAAILYRENMDMIKGGDEIKNQLSYIAMNIGYTQNPFLRSLDMIKKVSNMTDGFGQLVLHKGYQAEGHDDSHPDYGGHIGMRQGGKEDFNTLIEEGKKYGAEIGVHINATEYMMDAFEYPAEIVNENAPGWGWMDKSYYVDQRADVTTGELFRRLDMLKEDAPDLGWIYVDVYTGNGWNAHELANKIHELDYTLATEMNGPLEQDVVWTHWGGDPAYPNKGNASKIMRFMKNGTQDTFLADPLLKGNKHMLSGGWGDRHNIEGKYAEEVFYNQILPTKYMQHFDIVDMSEDEINFENGLKAIREGENINYYRDGRLVATTPESSIDDRGVGDTQLFLPWNPVEEDEKIYHWNPLGTTSTWDLPESWASQEKVYLYELSDLGRTFVKEVPVVNGEVTLEVDQDTAYIVLKEKVEVERVEDWGYGSGINDPGFDSQTFDAWEVESESDSTEHINIINETHERRAGNDIVEIGAKDAEISQKIENLESGKTYSVSVWVKNEFNRNVNLNVECGDEEVSNYVDRGSLERSGQAVKFRNDKFTRLEVEFTVPEGEDSAEIKLSVNAGEEGSLVYIDDFRLWETPGHTNKDGYVLYEDFENVDEGIHPLFLAPGRGNSNRTHLAEKDISIDANQRMNWVLDGRFSLKSNQKDEETGTILVTDAGTLNLEPNKTYELGFLYSLANSAPNYSVNIMSKSSNEPVATISLEATGSDYSQDVFTVKEEKTLEFSTGDKNDYYIAINKGSRGYSELILDNLYIKEIDKSIETPELAYVNLNTSVNNLEVGQAVEFNVNALMNSGDKVDLEKAKVEYKIANSEAISIENGVMTGLKEGISNVTVDVTVDGKRVSSNTVKIIVGNPEVEEEIIVSPVEDFEVIDKEKRSISVSWDEPEHTYGLEGYVLYKDGKKVEEISVDENEYTFKNLKRHTIYNFKIAAKYSNGEISAKESITVRTER